MMDRAVPSVVRIVGVAWLVLLSSCASAAQREAEAAGASAEAVSQLRAYLAAPADGRESLADQAFASTPLTRADAAEAKRLLWADHEAKLRADGAAEFEARTIKAAGAAVRFEYRVFGEKPAGGRRLFISMHGGGGAPPTVNDQQWRNQVRLYKPAEGVYVAPRAPTDAWNMWHQGHIDALFDRLIALMAAFEGVNPDRVYVMGYSAGGDGVYQIAPRMADRWAAAAMMAGHPNDASPLNLRNVPIALQVGEHDTPFGRNKIAVEWNAKLDELHEADPAGYEHWLKVHAGKGHWMDLQDAAAVPWMSEHERKAAPDRVVWRQSGGESRMYWLAVDDADRKGGSVIRATRADQRVLVESTDAERVIVRLNDEVLNMDEPVWVAFNGRVVHAGPVTRTIGTLARTLAERGDERLMYSGEVRVEPAGE